MGKVKALPWAFSAETTFYSKTSARQNPKLVLSLHSNFLPGVFTVQTRFYTAMRPMEAYLRQGGSHYGYRSFSSGVQKLVEPFVLPGVLHKDFAARVVEDEVINIVDYFALLIEDRSRQRLTRRETKAWREQLRESSATVASVLTSSKESR